MDEDEVLAKITRLLEKGCTMLASHHDCGAPLFRCQGEIVCPVCSFKEEPLSAMRIPATDSDRKEDDRVQNSSRAQSPQMQRMSPGPGMENYPSGRSLGEERSDRSMGSIQQDKSVERGQSDQSMDKVPSDRFVEKDRTDQFMNKSPSNQPIQDDALLISVRDNLRSVLLLRLQELTASLKAEQDLDKLERLLNCLQALLRVLRSLQD